MTDLRSPGHEMAAPSAVGIDRTIRVDGIASMASVALRAVALRDERLLRRDGHELARDKGTPRDPRRPFDGLAFSRLPRPIFRMEIQK